MGGNNPYVRSRKDSHEYNPATLPEPFEDLIPRSDGFILDLPRAAHAVRLLGAGASNTCEHAAAAHARLGVLLDYDQRVWPVLYARHNFHRSSEWRHAIDEVAVERILDGDDATLQTLLDAFAPVAEELAGLLFMLSERAQSGPADRPSPSDLGPAT